MRTSRRLAAVLGLALILGLAHASGAAPAGAPNPVVEGPIGGGIHGRPWLSSIYPTAPRGYVEAEYFFSGFAHTNLGTPDVPFKSRLIVRRPADPTKFNGTVVVEWLNVTGQTDLETVWPAAGEMMMKDGYAYVGLSAQMVGVCCGPLSLKGWDPARYGTLLHPGDDYSFDIFSQGIQALRDPMHNRTSVLGFARVDPMGGLRVRRVIGSGASQSASRLTEYVAEGGHHAAAKVIDAFLITRGGGPFPSMRTPILQLNEENNDNEQPDSSTFRFWQEAGISHAPADWWNYVWAAQTRDAGAQVPVDPVSIGCSVNRGPSRYTHRAAIHALQLWMTKGTKPAVASRVRHDDAGDIARAPDGIALGGIRYPDVAVPVALNTSEGCPLWGNYQPWPQAAAVRALYPTRAAYLAKVDAVVARLVKTGFLLPDDAQAALAEARAFDAWTGGSCYDTANPAANEDGPVSGVVAGLAYQPVPAGQTLLLHDLNCNVVARAGL